MFYLKENHDQFTDFSLKTGWLTTSSCCCCFSVQTGGLIMGWLGILSGALGILGYIIKFNAYIVQLEAHKISPAWSLAGSGRLKWLFYCIQRQQNLKTLHLNESIFYSDYHDRVGPLFVRHFPGEHEPNNRFSFHFKISLSLLFFLPLNRKR